MTSSDRDTTPYWSASASFPRFARLDADTEADVVVVGAGITGLTAAYPWRSRANRRGARPRACALVDTGHTSAHLTMVTDARLSELVDRSAATTRRPCGTRDWRRSRRSTTSSGSTRSTARSLGAGLLHAAGRPAAEVERAEATPARRRAGVRCGVRRQTPLVGTPGVRFDDQARFHPRRYLAGLAQAIVAAAGGSTSTPRPRSSPIEPRSVKANGHRITAATS